MTNGLLREADGLGSAGRVSDWGLLGWPVRCIPKERDEGRRLLRRVAAAAVRSESARVRRDLRGSRARPVPTALKLGLRPSEMW